LLKRENWSRDVLAITGVRLLLAPCLARTVLALRV
jgi:hypothetical protein